MPSRRALIGSLAAPALGAAPALAVSQGPMALGQVQLAVGFTPGGQIDIAARLAAPFLERHLGPGTNIIVINRPGAGGLVMLNDLATGRFPAPAAAFVSLPALVLALHDARPLYRADSFAYPGLMTDEPYSVLVGAHTPYRTLEDLLAAARAAPETIALAGAGAGSAPHLALQGLEQASGARFNWVPLPGAGQTAGLLQGGHVAGTVSTVSLTARPHREGTGRLLAIMDPTRWSRLPEVPTCMELGYPVIAGSARGIALPAGTPPAQVAQWESAIAATIAEPAFQAIAERDDIIIRHLDRAGMTALVAAQNAHYAALWRQRPWK